MLGRKTDRLTSAKPNSQESWALHSKIPLMGWHHWPTTRDSVNTIHIMCLYIIYLYMLYMYIHTIYRPGGNIPTYWQCLFLSNRVISDFFSPWLYVVSNFFAKVLYCSCNKTVKEFVKRKQGGEYVYNLGKGRNHLLNYKKHKSIKKINLS